MAGNQGGEAPVSQDMSISGDPFTTEPALGARHVQIPISASHGVQAGEGNTQVNNYFLSGKNSRQFPFWRAVGLGTAFAVTLAAALGFAFGTHDGSDNRAAASGSPVSSQPGQRQASASGASEATASAPATEFTVCTTPALTCHGSNATALKTEPSGILNSVDAAAYIKDLTWSDWGKATAMGRGILVGDDCRPDCAYGHDTTYAATVTLTRLASYGNGEQAYSSMAISVPSMPSRSETFSSLLVP